MKIQTNLSQKTCRWGSDLLNAGPSGNDCWKLGKWPGMARKEEITPTKKEIQLRRG